VMGSRDVRFARDEATEQARRFLELVAAETKQAQLMKRAGMIGIPPKHGAIKRFRRRRVSLARKQQRLIERRIARRCLRRHGNFGLVQISAPGTAAVTRSFQYRREYG